MTPRANAGKAAIPGAGTGELKGFSRTIAEIEWLLVILVLLYQIVQGRDDESEFQIYSSVVVYTIFVAGFRYFHIGRDESRWKLAIETWGMIVFLTWVIFHSGRLESPLVNLYLLTIVISALTLGKVTTLLEVALIAACYLLTSYWVSTDAAFWVNNAGSFATQFAPMLLVAYITTMLAADIHGALSRIKFVSETDELTGIYNLRAFLAFANRVHKESVRHGQPYSIVMLDCDNLKAVNDRYGHEAGNRLLKLTVACIQPLLRGSDVFARYGGDEFVMVLPQTNAEGAFTVMERIRKKIAATTPDTEGKQPYPTVSAGIATYPEHGTELAVVMNRADQALYASKQGGRNRISVSGDQ